MEAIKNMISVFFQVCLIVLEAHFSVGSLGSTGESTSDLEELLGIPLPQRRRETSKNKGDWKIAT
jgi:hypothetical protein